ncbi:hypothetical protein [Flavobacterium sp. WC2430]|uniref:hypothetical protein n=1 Tax=Flavobacterium sp. WC2430 TaxID=3234137 RepID=UPI0034658ED9
MKNIFYFLVTALCCISLVSCSNDEPAILPPLVIVPPTVPPVVIAPPVAVIPVSSLMKPAVVNIKGQSSTGRIAATKRLVKTITFTFQSWSDSNYKTKFTDAEYKALPTDNLYDPTEEALNVETKKFDERTYSYNSSGNLEQITINNIANPGYNNTPAYAPIIFSYLETGARVQITRYQDAGAVLVYEYNSIGQIIKARDLYGALKYTFEYDEANNIISKYLYYTSPDGNPKPQMHYTYSYFPNNTYIKNWISVDADGVEKTTSSVTYSYNKNIAGVYNNEAVYKVLMDNQEGLSYLHITTNSNGSNPKYFYDADGYLMKYDRHGLNNAMDITLFRYE